LVFEKTKSDTAPPKRTIEIKIFTIPINIKTPTFGEGSFFIVC